MRQDCSCALRIQIILPSVRSYLFSLLLLLCYYLCFILYYFNYFLNFVLFWTNMLFSPFCIIYCQFSTQGSHPTTQTFSTAFPGEIHIYVLNISQISPLEYISSTISLVHSTSFFTGATVTPYLVYRIYSGLLQSIFHLGIRGGVPKVQI